MSAARPPEGARTAVRSTEATLDFAEPGIANHPIVSRDRWISERKALLVREKELTRLRDKLARERRAPPWVRIEKDYVFDGPDGRCTLSGLFEGRSQLVVQHFPAEEAPGISVFYRDDAGAVFHTYSTYGRGVELMMGAYDFLDLAPKGRDEDGLADSMAWVRHHDRYAQRPAPLAAPAAASCCKAPA